MGEAGELERFMRSISSSVSGINGATRNTQNSYARVQRYARGTNYHPDGAAIINEEGPETVILPRGTKVIPANKSTGSVTNIFHVTIAAETLKQAGEAYAMLERLPQTL